MQEQIYRHIRYIVPYQTQERLTTFLIIYIQLLFSNACAQPDVVTRLVCSNFLDFNQSNLCFLIQRLVDQEFRQRK